LNLKCEQIGDLQILLATCLVYHVALITITSVYRNVILIYIIPLIWSRLFLCKPPIDINMKSVWAVTQTRKHMFKRLPTGR